MTITEWLEKEGLELMIDDRPASVAAVNYLERHYHVAAGPDRPATGGF